MECKKKFKNWEDIRLRLGLIWCNECFEKYFTSPPES